MSYNYHNSNNVVNDIDNDINDAGEHLIRFDEGNKKMTVYELNHEIEESNYIVTLVLSMVLVMIFFGIVWLYLFVKY